MIWKFGLSNIRRLPLVDLIELKPITILVGRNSSGKSTLLRSIALLRQSITTKTSSPILWYGELVDFGSFDISVHNPSLPISFSFYADQLLQSMAPATRYVFRRDTDDIFRGIHYSVNIIPHGQHTRISEIVLSINSPAIIYRIVVNDDNEIDHIEINGIEMHLPSAEISLDISLGSIFPDMNLVRKRDDQKRLGRSYLHFKIDNLRDRMPEVLFHFIKRYVSGNDTKILEISTDILSGSLCDIDFSSLKSMYGFKSWRAWSKLVDRMQVDTELYGHFMRTIYLSLMPDMMNRASGSFRSLTSKSLYIGPARARSDRYYRYQDLAVSEIDPDGKNFPMFLNSLSEFSSIWYVRLD